MLGPVHQPEYPSMHAEKNLFSTTQVKVLGLQQILFPPVPGATDVNVQNCHMIHTEVADINSWGTHGNRWQSGHMC